MSSLTKSHPRFSRTHRLSILSATCMVLILTSTTTPTAAAAYHTSGSSSSSSFNSKSLPELHKRYLAGLWRLTPRVEPMKEFTVYPKTRRKTSSSGGGPSELLLMLKEDGSFQQYENELNYDEDDRDDTIARTDLDASWAQFQETQRQYTAGTSSATSDAARSLEGSNLVQGTWDYVDGKLILAADRPGEVNPLKQPSLTTSSSSSSQLASKQDQVPFLSKLLIEKHRDTLLVGQVVATHETRLTDNPMVDSTRTTTTTNPASDHEMVDDKASTSHNTTTASSSSRGVALETHLSVPKGSVEIGKFMYPKKHPSFFDQPMFQPTRAGSFSLHQILGALNAGSTDDQDYDDEHPPERFCPSDFYNRTFLLTSYPIGMKLPKGRPRWSLKQNKLVHDGPNADALKAAQEAANRPSPLLRVLQIQLFANNTFATLPPGGSGSDNAAGESTILRGKYFVMGRERDQLWMSVSRFGFGRSVSGSVYSEGRMLTQDDAKTYWGKITWASTTAQEDGTATDMVAAEEKAEASGLPPMDGSNEDASTTQPTPDRLEVEGSVLFGSGLEPTPVARFIMREMQEDEPLALNLDDDDEEEEEDDEDKLEADLRASTDLGTDGIDLTQSDDAFQ